MCTREETQSIVDASEKRMEAKMNECRVDVDERIDELDNKLYKSHNAIATVQSEMGATLKRLTDKLEDFGDRFADHDAKEVEYQKKVDAHLEGQAPLSKLTTDDIQALKDVAQGYAGMSVMRKFILGIAGIIMAVGAIIGGFVGLIKMIK